MKYLSLAITLLLINTSNVEGLNLSLLKRKMSKEDCEGRHREIDCGEDATERVQDAVDKVSKQIDDMKNLDEKRLREEETKVKVEKAAKGTADIMDRMTAKEDADRAKSKIVEAGDKA